MLRFMQAKSFDFVQELKSRAENVYENIVRTLSKKRADIVVQKLFFVMHRKSLMKKKIIRKQKAFRGFPNPCPTGKSVPVNSKSLPPH